MTDIQLYKTFIHVVLNILFFYPGRSACPVILQKDYREVRVNSHIYLLKNPNYLNGPKTQIKQKRKRKRTAYAVYTASIAEVQ